MGWFYPSVDIEDEGASSNHGGQIDEQGNLDMLYYHPSTIPGHHLPHAWIERQRDRQKASTRDLLSFDRFLLITTSPALWKDAGEDSRELLSVVSVTEEAEDTEVDTDLDFWQDLDGSWIAVRGVSNTGAIIVRPDDIVVWRVRHFNGEQHAGRDGREWLRSLVLKSLKLEGAHSGDVLEASLTHKI